ncbi:methyl-accepting chemotaxis protein [Chromobacterium sp. IIBBL 290-4]|uniref:methyl-accepting chemotaxis protein n=1 Tax=Chromobacterium sp. IIBBL 290-4 TaxID=2953890 RepID=UPI0020B8B5B2|nr:methyl-accepting chemotaxis protein [Chromobacterium sp. IIBBL 290-4]UTH75465.1 methyl-accepting chemotaxis protein [Chromobacterium sp. IIBBL 290-4]
MLNAFNISQRILLLAGSLLLALFLVGGGAWWVMDGVQHELKTLFADKIAFRHQLDSMQRTMMQIRQDEKNIFISIGNPANTDQSIQTNKQALDQSIAKLRQQTTQAKGMAMAADHQAEFDGVLTGLDGYAQGMADLYGKIEKGQITAANVGDAGIIPFKPKLYAARDALKKMTELADNTAKDAEDTMMASMQRTIQLLATVLVLSLGVGAGLAWVISRSITKPLDSMQERMRHAAENNDLTVTIEQNGRDEVSETGRALAQLLGNLRGFIERTRQDSAQVNDTAASLSGVSQRIAEASRQQTDASSSTAAAVEEMTVSINLVAEHAAEMASEAKSSMQEAVGGSQVAGEAAREMSEIARVIGESETIIDSLNQRSDEIGNIVEVIHDIAEQTNLLALNAAIEAARAGEMGRGFAVVADEVRKLAERTAQATGEISGKIQAVQGDTATAVASMREAAERVDSGVKLSSQVTARLEQIQTLSASLLDKTSEIASAMREQGTASNEAARSVERIASMGVENGQSVEASSGMAQQLSQLAHGLDQAISRFRTA